MQEFYYALTVRPSSHFDLFRDFLDDTVPVGYEELDDAFVIRSEEELETISWGVEQFAEALQKALATPIDVELTLERHQNEDWIRAYQQSIEPVGVGPFYIHPTWFEPKQDAVNIVIDPSLAFGTGHHATTSTCLEAIAKYVTPEASVIDVGCGSGILGIAAAKLGAHVDACDTDGFSIESTQENLQRNETAFDHLWEGSASMAPSLYDVVIANIVADVLVMIASDLKKILKPSGILILSGILDKYEDKVLKKYSDYAHIDRIAQDEWVTLVLRQKLS